ncbi:hypothetical protein [Helicobacter sp.]|uniref:hypothetical protein n=1 Tax=Helicobacter sp. TaxID=218 RepID=UPI0025C6147B|nr:hypothetical protein [Helicobacter sp.]MCI5633735.1 hypothetical protein [Helicobacter sp.]MDY5557730.1 hypothetical protein [Helicobacter sp.]
MESLKKFNIIDYREILTNLSQGRGSGIAMYALAVIVSPTSVIANKAKQSIIIQKR